MKAIILFSIIFGSLYAGGTIESTKCQLLGCKKGSIAVDYQANLMWQDEPYTPQEKGAYLKHATIAKVGSYRYAKSFCEAMRYAGKSDWRLPSADELVETKTVFKNMIDGEYWTQTPSKKGFYAVYSADGYRYAREASKVRYIRCVRCINR